MKDYDEALRRIKNAFDDRSPVLDLRGLQLTTLPSEIGTLHHLIELNISQNELSDLPDEVGQLSQLRKLDLSRNQLRSFPLILNQLTRLTTLSLEENDLTAIPPLPFKHLKYLSLNDNKLGTLPVQIAELRQLKRLQLRLNQLNTLPPEIGHLPHLNELDLSFNRLSSLPEEFGNLSRLKRLYLQVNHITHLPDLTELTSLKWLNFSDNDLTRFPELPDQQIVYLWASSNPLREWSERGPSKLLYLWLRDCASLTSLPDWLKQVDYLDLHNCSGLSHLPDALTVLRGITVSGTGLTGISNKCRRAQIYWGFVRINEQIAFAAETLTKEVIFKERNAERRRVMIERMGYENFVAKAQPEILHEDTDAGGVRQLLRIGFPDDEPLVCLRVHDPSTTRQYLLRVPPNMETCHQAAAWIAGFDSPDDYRPLIET